MSALLLTVSACAEGGGSSDSAPRSTTTTTRAAAPPDSAVEEEVIAAYKAAEFAGARAGMVPDPELAELAATHTGLMLERAKELYRGFQLRKVRYRYPDPLESGLKITVDPATVEIDGDVAVLEACAVDEGTRVSTETQDTIAPDDGATTFLVKAAMRHENGTWKLAESKNLDSWHGVAGCAA